MRPLALIPLLLMGCKPEDELATLVSMVDATLPESAELASAAGFGTVEVPVRPDEAAEARLVRSRCACSIVTARPCPAAASS